MATQQQVAAHLDLSVRYIRTLQDEGVLPRASQGELDLDECRVRYIRHIRGVASGRRSDPSGALVLEKERARKEKEQADKYAMENAIRRGEFIAVDNVAPLVAAQVRAAQQQLRRVPAGARTSGRVPNLSLQDADVLLEMIDAALTEVANTDFPQHIFDLGDGEPGTEHMDDHGTGVEAAPEADAQPVG